MNKNINGIIEFVNDHILFGSTVPEEKVQSLIDKYQVSLSDQHKVYAELKDLNISIIFIQQSPIKVSKKIMKALCDNKIITEDTLVEWYRDHAIEQDQQKHVRRYLLESHVTILSKAMVQQNDSELDFLNNSEFDDLDTILDNDSFKEEVTILKEAPTRSKNNIYLSNYHLATDSTTSKTESLDNLVQANKNLVWKVVVRYKKFATNTFNIEDMYQVGMLGLLKAVEKFDLKLGNQFSTYAIWWIRQGITRGLYDYGTTIRIPVHMREKIVKLISTENQFWNDNSRRPTNKELSTLLNISIDTIHQIRKYKLMSNLTSLESTVGPDDDTEFENFVSNELVPKADFNLEKMALKTEIRKLFQELLTDREEIVLSFRYGLEDSKSRTLSEIGKILGVSRERVRQIESRAIRKLKTRDTLNRLGDFYYGNR